jgi:hypothetical protein
MMKSTLPVIEQMIIATMIPSPSPSLFFEIVGNVVVDEETIGNIAAVIIMDRIVDDLKLPKVVIFADFLGSVVIA